MIDQRPRPGVQDGQDADQAADVVGIPGQLDQGFGGGLHQEAVEDLLVTPHQGTESFREGEDHVEVGNWEEFRPSGREPLFRVFRVALGTASVPAGVIGVLLVAAMIAGEDVAAQGGGAAVLEVFQGPAMAGQNVRAEPLEILPAVAAEDVGHLGHGQELQVAHELIEGGLDLLHRAAGQVRVEGRTAMRGPAIVRGGIWRFDRVGVRRLVVSRLSVPWA